MAVLLIFVVIVAVAVFGFSVHFYFTALSTMAMHRQAMHALHQELAYRRLGRRADLQDRLNEEFGGEPR